MQVVFNVLSGILLVAGFIPYINYILKNRHEEDEGKPVKSSWLIWASNDTVILSGMYLKNTLNVQIVSGAFCAWLLVVLAFLYGNKGWKIIDIVCGVIAIIGIALSLFYENATVAILASNGALIAGAIPTFISTYKQPERENRYAWIFWFLSSISASAAVPVWDLDHATQPVTFGLIAAVQVVLIWIVPRLKSRLR